MAEKMLTVIMPTYNHVGFLAGMASSLCSQSYKDWQLYISDDHSIDETTAIANIIKRDHPEADIAYSRNEAVLGGSMNFNRALHHSPASKYVAVLQDNTRYVDEEFLSDAVAILEKYPRVNMAMGRWQQGKEPVAKQWEGNISVSGQEIWRKWPTLKLCWSACVFSREKLWQLGGLDTALANGATDLLCLQMALLGDIVLLDKVALEGDCQPNTAATANALRAKSQALRSAAGFAMQHGIAEAEAEEWYTGHLADYAAQMLGQAEPVQAKELLAALDSGDARVRQSVMERLANAAK